MLERKLDDESILFAVNRTDDSYEFSYPDKYNNPNLLTIGLMFVFMGMNIVLLFV